MSAQSRALLVRVFGYSEPKALTSGGIEYRCAFCDALESGGQARHSPICSYWGVEALFDGPIGESLIARWAAAPAMPSPSPERRPEHHPEF